MAGAAALAGMMGGAGAERARQTEQSQQNAADDARLAKQLAQQQGQYDTTLAENKRQYDTDYGLRSTAAGDAHKISDYTVTNLLPAQLHEATANTANTEARTKGVIAANALADATAGTQKQILAAQLAAAKLANVNNTGDTVAHRDAMVREAQQAQRELAEQENQNAIARIRLEASLRTVAATDPQTFMKQATAANTAAANEAQKLFGPTKPGETPMLSDAERKYVLGLASKIAGAPNPLQAAYTAINAGVSVKPADPNDKDQVAKAALAQSATAKAAAYLQQLGVAGYMTKGLGGTPTTGLQRALPPAPASGSLAGAVPHAPQAKPAGSIPAIAPKPAAPAGSGRLTTPGSATPMNDALTNSPAPSIAPSPGTPVNPLPQAPPEPPNALALRAKAAAMPPLQREAFIAQQPPAVQAILRQYFPRH